MQSFHKFQGVSRLSRVRQLRFCSLVQDTAHTPALLPDMDGGSRRRGDPGASNSDAFPNVYALVVYDNDAFRLCMYLVLMTVVAGDAHAHHDVEVESLHTGRPQGATGFSQF